MPGLSPPGSGPLGVSSIVMRPRHRSDLRPGVSSMDFVLYLFQGIGLAASIGVRPFLPVLLTGVLASADLGLDFDGTDFAFLEAWPFLLAVLVVVGGLEYDGRRRGNQEPTPLVYLLAAVAVA